MALDVTLTKTGNLTISGSSEDVKVLNTGTGNIEANKLEATGARITIKGSGNVSMHVEEELNAVLQGTGDLILQGRARLKSLVSGTGQNKAVDMKASAKRKRIRRTPLQPRELQYHMAMFLQDYPPKEFNREL
jgi:hypothetical protein